MVIVVINPTYNERENIDVLIEKMNQVQKNFSHAVFWQLIVDDNSPDGTSDQVLILQKKYSFIKLIQGEKKGLGEAYIRGIRYAIDELKADIVVTMDADLQHDPFEIVAMYGAINNGYDLIIGSRYVKGGSVPQKWNYFRVFNSATANFVARHLAGIYTIKDCTSGFRMIKVHKVLDKILFEKFFANGYSFQLVFLNALLQYSTKVFEYPICFNERYKGESKIGMNLQYIKDILEFLKNAFLIRRANLKIFHQKKLSKNPE